MKLFFENVIENPIRDEIDDVLQKCSLFKSKSIRIKTGEEAGLKEENDELVISLSERVINSPDFIIPQLKSLLSKSNDNLLNIFDIETKKNFFWEYVPELMRYVAVKESVMSPIHASSKMFLSLIKEKINSLNGKNVLDIGTGTGVLAIQLARCGAKVVAIDINPEAIENIKLNISLENSNIKDLVIFGMSNLYSNIYEITNKNQVFDYIFFNNPTIASSTSNFNDTNTFTDSNFQTLIQAIKELPKVLNKNGSAYFLVYKSAIKLKNIWTLHHIEEVLPKNLQYKLTDYSTEISKELGLAGSVVEILSVKAFE